MNYMDYILYSWFIFLPIITFVIVFISWKKISDTHPEESVVVPRYEPPAYITPIEAGFIIDGETTLKDIIATVAYLNINGYIDIEKIQQESGDDDMDYILIRTNRSDELLLRVEKLILHTIFNYHETVKLSELNNAFSKNMGSIRMLVSRSVMKMNHFSERPYATRNTYYAAMSTILMYGIVSMFEFEKWQYSIFALISAIVSAGIIGIFSSKVPKRTQHGSEKYAELQGLKMYLEIAQKDRIDFHNETDDIKERFEQLLPYAIALGVDVGWENQFDHIRIPSRKIETIGITK